MIRVFVRGGLGNQMFQYAAGLAAAKKSNTSLVLDTAYLNDRWPRKEFTYRTLDLDVFGIKPRLTWLSWLSEKFPIPGLWAALDFLVIKTRNILGIQKIIDEKEMHTYDPRVLSTDSALLFGYWQNEKYFSGIEVDIRSAFTFSAPLDEQARAIKEKIEATESVAICVRRGDFVKFASANKMMGDTNLTYYEKAIAYIKGKVKNPHFFVFSDDNAFCREHLGLPENTVYIDKLGPKWSFHLQLMSLCKYSIIANSTFYWWGAWLNSYKDKIVIAPARWYADRATSPEIFPKGWLTM
jgi:hypothetical protein